MDHPHPNPSMTLVLFNHQFLELGANHISQVPEIGWPLLQIC